MRKKELEARLLLLENKYDTIISNQEKILAELETLKKPQQPSIEQMPKRSERPPYKLTSKNADPLLKQAGYLFIENNSTKISLLIKELEIGFARAVKIMAQLQHLGLISVDNGNRTIVLNKEQFQQKLLEISNMQIV